MCTGNANACLDALTLCRRAQALVSTCLQLPLVIGAGMGHAAFSSAQSTYRGMAAISLDEYTAYATAALQSCCRWGLAPVSTVLTSNIEELRTQLPDAKSVFFSEALMYVGEPPQRKAPIRCPMADAIAHPPSDGLHINSSSRRTSHRIASSRPHCVASRLASHASRLASHASRRRAVASAHRTSQIASHGARRCDATTIP